MRTVRLKHRLWAFGLFLAVTALALAGENPTPVKPIADFRLTDLNGKPWSLHGQAGHKAVVVVFLSAECPMSNAYVPTLADLAKTYGPRGVAFAVVNANPEESVAQLQQHAKEYPLPMPVLRDLNQEAVRALQAEVNPEAFLLDAAFGLRYHGRIDDAYTARLKKGGKVSREDLREALDELLAGKPVSVPATKAFGCPIPQAKTVKTTGTVTYYRDVLPVLQRNCQSCHRPGEVGPFSLMTYTQARKWGSDIKDYVLDHRMPPWKPADSHGQFRGERIMDPNDIATLAKWVDEGMPEGDAKDAPPVVKFPEGWQLGEPDLVLEPAEEMVVGPTGRDLFRVMVFPTNLPEDRYVSAIEVRPGNKAVVHHTLNFVDTTGQARRLLEKEQARVKAADEQDRGPGYSVAMGLGFLPIPPKVTGMGGWAPGNLLKQLPDGVGYPLPKGADVAIQFHYHRTGKEERDRTRVGLHFAKKPVTRVHQPFVLVGLLPIEKIPANEVYKVQRSIWVDRDITVMHVTPHMHLLGKDIEATMTLPDGTKRDLIRIKDWDYNWQETYFWNEPFKVPAGTRFDVTATFDNTASNPLNPFSPPRDVRFGEQTTNEMCFVFLGCISDQPGQRIIPRFTPPPGARPAGK